MRAFAVVMLMCAVAFGHVGSPNVFFSGHAGSHEVSVIIRPPIVLPGRAHVDVMVENRDVTNVSVRAILAGAGVEAAPPSTDAPPVAGQKQHYATELWLLRSGSYIIEVIINGEGSHAVLNVPLDSAGVTGPAMPISLEAILIGFGILLCVGAIVIVRSLAREGALSHGSTPTPRDAMRGLKAGLVAALLVGVSLYAGGVRWRAMDRDFRENVMAPPVPVEARVRKSGSIYLLQLTRVPVGQNGDWSMLATDHGKLVHLFLISEPGQSAFAHLHPVRRDLGTFECVLPSIPAGQYAVYGELTYGTGRTETLVGKVSLPVIDASPLQSDLDLADEIWCRSGIVPLGEAAEPLRLDSDDSWHVNSKSGTRSRAASLIGGNRMVLRNAAEFVADEQITMRFAVFSSDGNEVPLERYMGMRGHAVVRRNDGAVFTHLHPLGSISMAAQEILTLRAKALPNTSESLVESVAPAPAAGEVVFPYAFPKPGEYRIWIQVRVDGRVVTGVFDVTVKPEV